eukprot:5025951-Prymnesium_polylepis.2
MSQKTVGQGFEGHQRGGTGMWRVQWASGLNGAAGSVGAKAPERRARARRPSTPTAKYARGSTG